MASGVLRLWHTIFTPIIRHSASVAGVHAVAVGIALSRIPLTFAVPRRRLTRIERACLTSKRSLVLDHCGPHPDFAIRCE
jgi:hypothetical protein